MYFSYKDDCLQPELIEEYAEQPKIEGVTGFILAGGASRRMGKNKALLQVDGIPIITRSYRTLAKLFHKVIIVTNSPEEYDFLPCQKVADIYPNCGSIAGLHSALAHCDTTHSFITACDMPFLDPAIIRYLCTIRNGDHDAVVPHSEGGQEPLHAVYYSSVCKEVVGHAIEQGERKIVDVLGRMKIRQVTYSEIQSVVGKTTSFYNVNTPEEYELTRTFR